VTGEPAVPESVTLTTSRPDPAVRRATLAVYVAFAGNGFAFASWAARIPQVRDKLHVSPGGLGLLLLCISIGSIVAMPLAGLTVTRLGESRAVAVMSLILATGLGTVAIGYRYGVAPVAVGLLLLGFGNGTWDVAMNVQGAYVEQRLGRVIMPRFHAGWSIGTVTGAGIGSAMVALHVSVTAHLIAVTVLVAAGVPPATRLFLRHRSHAEPESPRSPLAAWLEPRTLLIGLFVLCMAFSEGTGNDWLGVAMIDGYHVPAAIGTLTFAVFLAAMTTGRWFGPGVIDRHGRVPVLRVSAAVALAGLLLVVFGTVVPLAILGVVLWGLGSSLGFPVGLSAAADDPRYAAGRVSVASSIGYCAFLGGPPVVGFLGDHVGVLRGLIIAAGLLGLAILVSRATAPLPPSRS
jgi:MFS family permease